jgi:hypothetical protein
MTPPIAIRLSPFHKKLKIWWALFRFLQSEHVQILTFLGPARPVNNHKIGILRPALTLLASFGRS